MENVVEKEFIKDEEKFIKKEEASIEEVSGYHKTSTYETYVLASLTGNIGLTAAATFFASIMISKYDSFNPSVNIPTLFLIISTFGFLYATLIFGNNIVNVIHFNPIKFNKGKALAGALTEYLGIYFLMLSIPLIVNTVSTDLLLRAFTTFVDLAGLVIYHSSGFCVMERHFKEKHWLLLGIMMILEVILVVFQFSNLFVFEITSIILLLYILGLTFISRNIHL